MTLFQGRPNIRATHSIPRLPRVAAVASFALIAATIIHASAAVINVTTTADTINAVDGVTSLREAFITANAAADDDTIVLQADALYMLDFCSEGALVHATASTVTLQGNGAMIQNTCVDVRTIEATDGDGTISIAEVEMTGAPGTIILDGAAVFSDGGAIAITGANIHGFAASAGSDVIDGGSAGGSITLINTQVWGNVANAVRLSLGSVTITDCLIYDNTGGGVQLVDGSPLVVTDTEITGNGGRGLSTTGQGSTIATLANVALNDNADTGFSCSACGTISITNSVITGNGHAAPPSGGGGVRVAYDQDDPADAPSTTIIDSIIDSNIANHSGGGIEIGIIESSEPTAPPAVLDIRNTSVSHNTVNGANLGGGGIHVRTGGLSLTAGSIVEGNVTGAGGSGGGVLLAELGTIATPAPVVITDAAILDNTADHAGGGLHLTTDGLVTITTTEINDNRATNRQAGGALLADADAVIHQSTIDNNVTGTAGGGIVLAVANSPEATLAITESTISHNQAPFPLVGNGGGLLADDEETGLSVTIENSTISNNSAFSRGGGVHAFGGTHVTMQHVTLVENAAPNGANLHMTAGDLDLQASLIALPVTGDNATLLAVTVNSGGRNFLSDDTIAAGPTDTVSAADPLLAPLAPNGGPTLTRLPAAGSPIGGLVPVVELSLPTDQRGVARPQGDDGEPGAVEITESPDKPKPKPPKCKRHFRPPGHGHAHPHRPPGMHPGRRRGHR